MYLEVVFFFFFTHNTQHNRFDQLSDEEYVSKSMSWKESKLAQLEEFTEIHGIAVDDEDNIYFTAKNKLYRINKDELTKPQILWNEDFFRGVVWDGKKSLYCCSCTQHQIGEYRIDTGQFHIIAGNGEEHHKDGMLKDASFCFPFGIARDLNGDLYITNDHFISKINLSKGTVQTIAGSIEEGYKDGDASQARFELLWTLMVPSM